eukprot:TRINITY_DN46552_c0_g1_i1.p1 TRINITY_DN46552_c0_g1~~TRINITY_DN46552_c0_g1_i1.p1  ORF type:complete len:506 (+),score=75.62 TRINITY_DN46552_c0_g1_i1:58-1518(+)
MEKRQTVRTFTYETRPCLVWAVLGGVCLMSIGKSFGTVDLALSLNDFKATEGVSEEQVSLLFATGYFMSAFGKVFGGLGSDILGGKLTCLAAIAIYICVTVVFSYLPTGTPVEIYAMLWGMNLLSNLGILGVSRVAVATNWIPPAHLGRLMSLVSMSTDIGDATCRIVLAPFLALGWRKVFQVSAMLSLASGLPMLFIGDSPKGADDTLQEGKKVEENLAAGKPKKSFWQKVKPMLSGIMIYALCVLSGVLYGTRTLFLTYSADYLAEVRCKNLVGDKSDLASCLTSSDTLASTALASSAFTFLGCGSPLIVGFMKDALSAKHRAAPLVLFIGPLTLSLGYLTMVGTSASYLTTVIVMSCTGAFLAGPFKTIGPVFAVDVAGKEAKGTALSVVGIANNVAAVAMIALKGVIGKDWSKLFGCLTIMSAVALLFALYIWSKDLGEAAAKATPSKPPAEIEAPLVPLEPQSAAALQRRASFQMAKSQEW